MNKTYRHNKDYIFPLSMLKINDIPLKAYFQLNSLDKTGFLMSCIHDGILKLKIKEPYITCTILQDFHSFDWKRIDTLYAYFTPERYFNDCSICFSTSCQTYDGKAHGDFPFIEDSPKEITTSIIPIPEKMYTGRYNQSNLYDWYDLNELYNSHIQVFFENMFLVEYENGYIPIDLNR